MKNTKLIAVLSMILAVLMMLSACSTDATSTPDATATPEVTEQPTQTPTEEPTPIPTEEPTPTPTPEPTPTPTPKPEFKVEENTLINDKLNFDLDTIETNLWYIDTDTRFKDCVLKEGLYYTEYWDNRPYQDLQQMGFFYEFEFLEEVTLSAVTIKNFCYNVGESQWGTDFFNAPNYDPTVCGHDPNYEKIASDPNEKLVYQFCYIDADGNWEPLYQTEDGVSEFIRTEDGKVQTIINLYGNEISSKRYVLWITGCPARAGNVGSREWKFEPMQFYTANAAE